MATTRPGKVTSKSTKSKNVGVMEAPPRPSLRSFCKADSGNAGWRGVQGWGGEGRRAKGSTGGQGLWSAVCGLHRRRLLWRLGASSSSNSSSASTRANSRQVEEGRAWQWPWPWRRSPLALGLWRLDRAAEVGLLHCGWPMGARRASLPRADADPVILLDLPVVCPSGRLTGFGVALSSRDVDGEIKGFVWDTRVVEDEILELFGRKQVVFDATWSHGLVSRLSSGVCHQSCTSAAALLPALSSKLYLDKTVFESLQGLRLVRGSEDGLAGSRWFANGGQSSSKSTIPVTFWAADRRRWSLWP
ncbi:hypothetical protein F5882DRAFT_382357 [Hyaloscypha sp. PMI_1271]|nr:hypothetical protein F5882DRAFT_382357 [Hyaloscypha sp. PMI_1271]